MNLLVPRFLEVGLRKGHSFSEQTSVVRQSRGGEATFYVVSSRISIKQLSAN